MFVRQSAWLNAIPEEPQKRIVQTTGKKDNAPKPVPVSRLKRLADAGEPIPLPPLTLDYLVAFLWEIGPTMTAGMGEAPLSHLELRAWQDNTGIEFEPWEVRMLRRLSRDYSAESQRATKESCPAPYGEVTRRVIVAKKIDDVFG